MTRRTFLHRAMTCLALSAVGGCAKTTWPVRGSEKGTARLIFYTDVHARKEWETPLALKKAAAAINAKEPDLVISGGDMITDGFQNSAAFVEHRWEAYMTLHRGIKADLYPAIGNHDLVAAIPEDGTPPAKDPRAIFLTQTGLNRTYYSFDAVGYHFIFLDSIQISGDEYKYHGMIGSEQIEWLKQDLAKVPKSTPIVITTHIPLLSAFYFATRGATTAAPKNRVIVNNVEVLNIIKEHNVILVLQGHLHVKEMIRWRGTTFIDGGAICGKWWRGSYFDTHEGFNHITLAGDHIDWKYIDYGWKVRRPKNK